MDFILKNLIKVFGLNRLVLMVWDLAKPQLLKLAKKTETTFDDDAINMIDQLLRGILNQPAVVAELGPVEARSRKAA